MKKDRPPVKAHDGGLLVSCPSCGAGPFSATWLGACRTCGIEACLVCLAYPDAKTPANCWECGGRPQPVVEGIPRKESAA